MNGGMFRRAVFGPFFLADISCEKLSSLDFDLFSGAMLPWLQTRRYGSSPWRKDRPWTPSLILCQCRKSPRFASKGTSANWLCSVWCFTIISTQTTLSNGEAELRMVREQPTTLASLASGCERGGEPT